MTLSNPKNNYQRFLKGHEGKLHFAAHSHHFWPDVTRDAQLQYWDDCALMSDEKWNKIFGEVIPQTQMHIARMLKLQDHRQIALAPNTHELATRVLSLFLGKPSLSILTTTNEFHSWGRQLLRLKELSQIKIIKTSTQNFLNERRSVIDSLKEELMKAPDLFYFSHVFFDSGVSFTDAELLELTEATPASTLIVIDGYHAFAAIPADLSKLEGRVFYLGGGYKYAQAGEGAGFMVVPKGSWRPANTGWFAEYGELSKPRGAEVGYTEDGMAFMGATQDPSGFYRFNAVWDQLEGITIGEIHQYVKTLQLEFIKNLPPEFISHWKLTALFEGTLDWHGHFLTFQALDEKLAIQCQEALQALKIVIDRRGARLRFGFGLYQDLKDVSQLTKLLLLTCLPPQQLT